MTRPDDLTLDEFLRLRVRKMIDEERARAKQDEVRS